MSGGLLSRSKFREKAIERDDNTCVIPWCTRSVDEVHHIIERRAWDDGGYYLRNAASVCNKHHKYAEVNAIPPQTFWMWLDVEPMTPEGVPRNTNKWGDTADERAHRFEIPPWEEHRDYIKYPSTRHVPFSHISDDDDTAFREVDTFLDKPLVTLIKIDGGNASIVKDAENPVRARNAKHADHESFDLFKQLYWEKNMYDALDPEIQVFGEWSYAKHTIHYGCDDGCEPRNQAPPLDAYFLVFGVYNTKYRVWLSWPEVKTWADKLGVPTVPVVRSPSESDEPTYTNDNEFYENETQLAKTVVSDGHEGTVIRQKFPFHYGQFSDFVGKYVRENHVPSDRKHWKHQQITPNHTKNE